MFSDRWVAVWVAVTVAGLLLAPFPVAAGETRLTGRIVGYNCYTTGRGCAKDRNDPVVEMERDFVLVTGPDSYYLLPNVDRSAEVDLVGQEVTVYGELDPSYRSLVVERIEAAGVVVWLRVEAPTYGRGPSADRAWYEAVMNQKGGRPNAPEGATDPTLENLYGGY